MGRRRKMGAQMAKEMLADDVAAARSRQGKPLSDSEARAAEALLSYYEGVKKGGMVRIRVKRREK